ncbi:MAG TPA: hypothetical protein DCP20_05925 [Coriobacteriia bacterium]|nr:MAG: Uncharacterized protein XD74_0190 [Actinobacteria bacterium 66_15]HAL30236.1 hypothetical protein [Coriobacteriia bacterium]
MREPGLFAISRSARPQQVVSLLLALALVASIAPPVFAVDPAPVHDYGPGKHTADLLAGNKLTDVGSVEVFNDQQKLYVSVLPDGWQIAEVQIYAGHEPIPVNRKGQPAPGQFPYKVEYEEPVAEYRKVLDLRGDLGVAWGVPFVSKRVQNIAVHVSLVDPATGESTGAWAEGARFFVEKSPAVGAWFSYLLERPRRGHFIDAPVGGLGYTTETFDSATDVSGSFLYFPGETVTFFLAGYPIGSAVCRHRVSPLDIFNTADIGHPEVGNMAWLLQSLDADGNPKDRIFIPEAVHEAVRMTIAEWEDAEDAQFEGFDFTDTEMIGFIIDGAIAKTAGMEGVTLVKGTKAEAIANLAKTLEETNAKFIKNVSKTPDQYTTKSRIELAPFYVPATSSDGDATEIEYHDEYGELIGTRTEARPIIMAYLDAHPETGALDVWSAVSLDDGNTWKRRNLSRSADRSSFTLANGEEYYGACEKPSLHVKDNMVLIVWTGKYARGGKPRYSIETSATDPEDDYPYDDAYYADDIWGVGGPQRSTDYTELGFPEVGEIPYNVVWTQRGIIDKTTGALTWYKPERLTSGRRNAMQLVEASAGNGAGFAVAWQEDPEGIRPGQGKGSGVGWSGAIASHGTDIWYSYIAAEDFATIDENWVSGGDPEHDWDEDIVGRPKALVPFSLPVRISDNETINSNNIKVELDGDGLPMTDGNGDYIPIIDEETGKEVGTHSYAYETPGVIADWYATTNWQGVEKQVAITADGRLLDGDTAATRPALFLQGYTKPDGTKSAWAIVGYEESKGTGGGGPLGEPHEDVDDPDEDPEVPAAADCDDATAGCWECHYDAHAAGSDQTECYSCHSDEHPYVTAEAEELEEGDDESGDGIGRRYKPDIGKNIIYHSFDWQTPNLVSGGTILNQQAVDPLSGEDLFLVDEEGQPILDYLEQPIPAYENARRPRFLVQGKSLAIAGKPSTAKATVMVLVYKQGEDGRGGPSDIFIRRWEVAAADKGNPYDVKYLVSGDTNVSAVTPRVDGFWENPDQDDPDKGIKLIRWDQTADNLDDYSWEYPGDNAQAQRGYLRGDLLVLGYTWTPNWRSARNANDIYNLYVRRSFDGGRTFTTTPASDPYGVYEYNGQGAVWSELFRNPQEGTTELYELSIPAGEFEPARNITQYKNNKINCIEPRIVPPGPVIAGSPYPEDVSSLSTIWLTWGTGATHAVIHGDSEEEEEDTGKMPLDLQYTYSLDWGDTWVLEEKTVNPDSDGNYAGETTFRPFYLAKGDSMQGEAQVKLSADASKAFVVWNDEGIPPELLTDPSKVEMDTFFRRIMPYEVEHNQALADPVFTASPTVIQ